MSISDKVRQFIINLFECLSKGMRQGSMVRESQAGDIEDAVVEFGHEGCHPSSIGGDDIAMAAVDAFDQALETQASQIVSHFGKRSSRRAKHGGGLARGVASRDAESSSEGGSKTAEGGKQGHDSRLTKTQPWRSLTRRSHGRLRHSKKTLGTEKAVLTDAFVRQQTLIDSPSQLAARYIQFDRSFPTPKSWRIVDRRLRTQGTVFLKILLHRQNVCMVTMQGWQYANLDDRRGNRLGVFRRT